VGDGPKTFEEFKVDLQQMHSAIGSVRREHTAIRDAMSAIGAEFSAVKEAWDTPQTPSYDDTQAWFVRVAEDLEDLLNDMANRLQTAYNNYKHSEETNVKNLTARKGDPVTHHTDSVPPGKHGADHGQQHPAATLRERLQEHPAATLREAARPASAQIPAVPPNSG
jgi:uncharacterized protein YukE